MNNLLDYKELVEGHPVAFATVTSAGNPNAIGVAAVKVVSDHQILITDNYMNQTIKDLETNPNVCLVVWNESLSGCKIIGRASYQTEGEWKEYIERMEENKGLPAKGAILIDVLDVIPSK